jgi:apolipoprotein D and lipocalin family protein
LLVTACSVAPPEGVTPVRDFEVDRYLGTWYEVGRLDHRFERDLVAVTAEYALREDGGLSVTNRGYDTASGEWDAVEGRAYFTGADDVASLKVSFFGPFYGGYHVLALDRDAPDYGYALVSGPNRDYLWLLSRSPELPADTYDALVEQAGALGFPVEELIRVEATPPAGAPPRLTPP